MLGLHGTRIGIVSCVAVGLLGLTVMSQARTVSRDGAPSLDQCRQQFAQSPAAAMCSPSVNVTVPEPGVCAIQATCRTGRGSVSKTGVRATYPEGVRELVNCNGSLRHKRC